MRPPTHDAAPRNEPLPEPEDEAEEKDVAPLDVATLALRIDERGRLYASERSGDMASAVDVGAGKPDTKTGALPGERRIVARRAFPWSKPDAFISLRTPRGTELALLDSLDDAPVAARPLLQQFLSGATFVPKITRVDRISLEHGYQQWNVQTEAGSQELRVQEREDVRFFSDTRFTVKDAHGNVFEIADARTLDDHSRRELARIM